MEPGDYSAVPELSYPNSAPSVMSSDPGHLNHAPLQYMPGFHLAPPSASFFSRGRTLETNYEQQSRPSQATRSRAPNSSRDSSNNNNTLQPPRHSGRRASEPGKRPIPVNHNKRKREEPDGRIKCHHCDETFKMPADRERHVKVKHISITKFSTVWVCRDRKNLIPAGYGRWIPLDKCKACREGKRYNAPHNAEEHLRRRHFYPRIPGSKPQNDEERRGGKGGGKDPCAQYLKDFWIDKIDICHRLDCDCGFPHQSLPNPDADRRRSSRSAGTQNFDVDMRDDASESSYAHSSISGGISPLVADSQEYYGSANTMTMWGQQSPMVSQANFDFSPPLQPGSFSSGNSFPPPPPSSFHMMPGSRPGMTSSQQNSGASLSSHTFSANKFQQDQFEFDPDLVEDAEFY